MNKPTEKFIKLKKNVFSEKTFFLMIIFSVFVISLYMKDSPVAVFAAVCGTGYTLLAGKGKIYCYFIGMAGTLCYAYLAYKNALYGNCALYACCYFPMEIAGIIKWRRHIDEKTKSVIKTNMPVKNNLTYIFLCFLTSFMLAFFMQKAGNLSPYADSFATVFSVYGMFLTVKRCIEQWDVWFFVNVLSLYAWGRAYINGSNSFSMLVMWSIYIFLAVYFKRSWKKEMFSAA